MLVLLLASALQAAQDDCQCTAEAMLGNVSQAQVIRAHNTALARVVEKIKNGEVDDAAQDKKIADLQSKLASNPAQTYTREEVDAIVNGTVRAAVGPLDQRINHLENQKQQQDQRTSRLESLVDVLNNTVQEQVRASCYIFDALILPSHP